jgi:hypothetical protein
MGIPYKLIGVGIAFLLGVLALILTDTAKGRMFIAMVMLSLYFLPVVWHSSTSGFVSFMGWIVFGLGCYIFIKWHKI